MAKLKKKPAASKAPAKPASVAKTAPKREWSPAQLAVQSAGKLTGDIVCSLQRVRKEFLRVGQLLVEARDRKVHETLKHETMESYAAEHLRLSPTSMYRYMKAYTWVLENHKEWLEPGAKIPDLSSLAGLIWIDKELKKEDLDPQRKKALVAVQKKAEGGKLPRKELRAFKRRNNSAEKAKRKYLAKLRALRREGKDEGIDSKVLAFLDQAIGTLEHELMLDVAGMGVLDDWKPGRSAEFFSRNLQWA